ncbi:MAG TPA: hypothetical protein VGO52_18250 [Hyphomonadaceae bacterium]|jgi:hypothetical protein|nr:hypothetical protein [Hyphomonadaceae bacterium]
MKRVLAAVVLGCVLGASACESMPVFGGNPAYTEDKVTENRWRVSYQAPEGTKAAVIADRTLARAAQVTLDKGNEWFEIAQKIDGKNMQTLVIQMGRGETLAGGSAKQYDAKATLARLKDKIS